MFAAEFSAIYVYPSGSCGILYDKKDVARLKNMARHAMMSMGYIL